MKKINLTFFFIKETCFNYDLAYTFSLIYCRIFEKLYFYCIFKNKIKKKKKIEFSNSQIKYKIKTKLIKIIKE